MHREGFFCDDLGTISFIPDRTLLTSCIAELRGDGVVSSTRLAFHLGKRGRLVRTPPVAEAVFEDL